ncbi:hypothetical protein [Paenibacillus herberti]|uniref:hypothetical protein n=1 Tax=Paenibacillus herberti TaxID=1619309 RepID=UPI0011321E11|nr:hypothetical protein [Paenibacillus herberti]
MVRVRYEAYYHSGEWEREPLQPSGKKIFPAVWISGVGAYAGIQQGRSFRVVQGKPEEIVRMMERR